MRIHVHPEYRPARLFSVAVLVLILCGQSVLSQERQEVPGSKRSASKIVTIESGFLFINGRYVEPPYRIGMSNGQVQVNGKTLKHDLFGLEQHRGRRNPRRSRARARNSAARYLTHQLADNSVVVLFSRQDPVTLESSSSGIELLNTLCDPQLRRRADMASADWLPPQSDVAIWNQWVRNFAPSRALQDRVNYESEQFDTIEASNIAEINAVHRLDSASYPMTVLAMVLTVLAFGHLLSYRPDVVGADERRPKELSVAEARIVHVSLGLICAFSVFDVAWTILASAAGTMHELNPLGSRLIQDPYLLIAFKLTATALSVGLLYSLRRHALARRAAWWGCLVLTLLTVRWLVFSSMFVA